MRNALTHARYGPISAAQVKCCFAATVVINNGNCLRRTDDEFNLGAI